MSGALLMRLPGCEALIDTGDGHRLCGLLAEVSVDVAPQFGGKVLLCHAHAEELGDAAPSQKLDRGALVTLARMTGRRDELAPVAAVLVGAEPANDNAEPSAEELADAERPPL